MKVYGETIFDSCYLLIAIIMGIMILAKSKNKLGKMMGAATLILGIGDSFHLVPRMLDYFVDADFTAAIRNRKTCDINHNDDILYIYVLYLRKQL